MSVQSNTSNDIEVTISKLSERLRQGFEVPELLSISLRSVGVEQLFFCSLSLTLPKRQTIALSASPGLGGSTLAAGIASLSVTHELNATSIAISGAVTMGFMASHVVEVFWSRLLCARGVV
jgi:hypothetical protein